MRTPFITLLALALGLLSTMAVPAWTLPRAAQAGGSPAEQKPVVFPGEKPEPPKDPEVYPGAPEGPGPGGAPGDTVAPGSGDTGAGSGADGGGAGGAGNGVPPQGGGAGPGGGAPPAGPGPTTGSPTLPAPGGFLTPISGFVVDELDPTGIWTWFELRRDGLLDLDARLAALTVPSGSSEFFLGRGIAGAPRATPDPGPERALAQEVGLELLEIAEQNRQAVLAQSALIGLGQIYPALEPELARRADAAFRARIADPEQAIQEGAVLGAGLSGAASQLSLLAGLAADSDSGRRSARVEVVPFRIRAFSAYALGLAGRSSEREDVRRFAVHHLVEVLDGEGGARRTGALPDVDAAALLGLALAAGGPLESPGTSGSAQPPSSSRSAALRYLIDALQDGRRFDRRVRAVVPGALARIYLDLEPDEARALRPFVAEPLLELVARARKEPNELLRGVAQALGWMADADDSPLSERLRDALHELAEVPDRRTNTLAVLSLGQAVGRSGAGPAPRANAQPGLHWLATRALDGGTLDRPAATLALGLAVQGLNGSGVPCPDFVREALIEAARDARSPDELAASALAAGFASVVQATPVLMRSFERASALETRGRVALGLGLLGSADVADEIAIWAGRDQARPTAVRDGVIALALLGLRERALEVAAFHIASRSSLDQESGARSLGAIGGADAGELMRQLLASDERPSRARALSALGLGRLLDPRLEHSFDDLSDVANPFAGVDSLYRGSGLAYLDGLLDLEPGF